MLDFTDIHPSHSVETIRNLAAGTYDCAFSNKKYQETDAIRVDKGKGDSYV